LQLQFLLLVASHPYPYASWTDDTLQMLANLKPKLLAIMHGSSYSGDGERALRELAAMFAATLGGAGMRG
jgi:hypothetical protein